MDCKNNFKICKNVFFYIIEFGLFLLAEPNHKPIKTGVRPPLINLHYKM